MPIRLTISSNLFADGDQEVVVRDQLSVKKLIAEIQQEYQLSAGAYVLCERGTERALDESKTLEQEGVRNGMALVFGLRQGIVQNAAPTVPQVGQPCLQSTDGRTYPLLRQPALIGRPSKDITAAMLDVDLTPLDPNHSSSRPHARIVRNGEEYFLESLRKDNPAYLNGVAVSPEQKQALRSGDSLRFGNVQLTFVLKKA